jgi:hypothetical protein
VGPKKGTANAWSAPDEPLQKGEQKSDPAALTIQQALTAAALLSGPNELQQQQQQQPLQQQQPPQAQAASIISPRISVAQDPSTAPFVNTTPSSTSRASSTEHVQGLVQEETTRPVAPAPTTLQPHSLALILDQSTAAMTQPHGATSSTVTNSMLHAMNSPASPQGIDLHQLDALVRDIADLSGSSGRAAVRLTAEQLGPLEIKLHRSDAGMTVSIRTQSEQSHSTVAQAQQQLADDMRANGLKVAATSVILGHGGAGAERHDRQPFRFGAPIEAATTDSDQPQTPDEERPSGRYA